MALGKHLVQAMPSVYALQCLTGKVDNNNNVHTGTWKYVIDLRKEKAVILPVIATHPLCVGWLCS